MSFIAPIFYATIYLGAGLFLHPILKVFYKQKSVDGENYGDTKNTVSVLDMGVAVLALILIRVLVSFLYLGFRVMCGCKSCKVQHGKSGFHKLILEVPFQLFKVAFLPGMCIFLAVVLATQANFESFYCFIVLAPMELVFILFLISMLKWDSPENKISRPDLGCAICILLGAVFITVEHVSKQSGPGETPAHGWIYAIVLCLIFRFVQATNSVVLRKACLKSSRELRKRLGIASPGGSCGTLGGGLSSLCVVNGDNILHAGGVQQSTFSPARSTISLSNLPASAASTKSLNNVVPLWDLEAARKAAGSSSISGDKTNPFLAEEQDHGSIVESGSICESERNSTKVGGAGVHVFEGTNARSMVTDGFWSNFLLVLDLAICKLVWVTLVLIPYGVYTEGFKAPWMKLFHVFFPVPVPSPSPTPYPSSDPDAPGVTQSSDDDTPSVSRRFARGDHSSMRSSMVRANTLHRGQDGVQNEDLSTNNAMLFLLLTIGITCVFQFAHVGLLSCFPVLHATSIVQLQPVCQILMAFVLELAVPDVGKAIGMGSVNQFLGKWNIIGCFFLLIGSIGLRTVKGKRKMSL